MNWIHCLDRFAVLRILCIHITESGFTVFWTLSIPWSGQYSCANSLNISIQTFCEIGYHKDQRIRTFHVYRTLNRSQDTDICVLMDIGQITEQIAGCSEQTCQLQWSGQIGFIIVLLYKLLRAYQLTVTIIFNC